MTRVTDQAERDALRRQAVGVNLRALAVASAWTAVVAAFLMYRGGGLLG